MSKKYYAVRDFKDAGTERTFVAGEPVNAEAGEIANYAAAGLVTDADPKAAPAKAPDSGKTAA